MSFNPELPGLDDFGDRPAPETLRQIRDMTMAEYCEFHASLAQANARNDITYRSRGLFGAPATSTWKAARQRFIDGDDAALDEMLAAVRTEDAAFYDQAAGA